MFHRFFRESLNKLKNNQRTIENTAYGVVVATSMYQYPKVTEKWIHSHMSLFYSRLSEEQKAAIEQDPEKKHEFIEDCKYRMKLIIGPPD